MYTVLGATGNVGAVITTRLLEKGEKVRAVGRNAKKLESLASKGAEPLVANIGDPAALTNALQGARAAFLMLPPNLMVPDYVAEQDREGDAILAAVERSGLKYAVLLSSFGAQALTGGGPISGLGRLEQKLNKVPHLHALYLRAGSFMENELNAIDMVKSAGIFGTAFKVDLPIPKIATRDIGAYAAQRLLKLDFSGKQTQELLGPRDVTMQEMAAILGNAIGKPNLPCVPLSYEQVAQALTQMGFGKKTVGSYVEMIQGINTGLVRAHEPRSSENTTPTTYDTFAKEVFLPAYQAKAATA